MWKDKTDVDDFVEDFHEANVGKIGERKRLEEKLDCQGKNIKNHFDIKGIPGEDKYVMKYRIAAGLEKTEK
jgi:hypothetical protein